eukprot:TRINITY_DN2528_c0_g2_i2.p1 TRINITY_DN2528_c0_g2~~TRINITY_DN2528_c0_g2_i2.p1  ORF type:complete len:490 (-),score=164.16 TRINITY_DN2528_c0_g2_i2:122-1591(-)
MSQTLEAQLASLSIKEKDVAQSIFNHCMQETLHEIWAVDNPRMEENRIAEGKKAGKMRKSDLVTALLLGVNNTAARCFVERLTKKQIVLVCDGAPIVHKINYTNKDGTPKDIPLIVLQKRLREVITVKSPFTQQLDDENTPPGTQHYYIGDFFDKFHAKNTSLLKDLCSTFDIEVSSSAKNSELRQALVDGLLLSGLYVFLEGLSMALLRDVAENNGFDDVDSVTSKSRLIEALLTGKMPEPKVVNKAPTKKEIGRKRSIANSDKYGLQQHYTAARLVKYCQEHNLKSSGSKAQLIERIISWKNCETAEGKRKYERKTPYEPKAKSSKSKKSAKKESDSESNSSSEEEEEVVSKTKKNRKSTSKAAEEPAASPKQEKQEKQEVQDEPAEEEEEEKNRKILRDPESFEIDDLRAYCEEFEITVTKKGKRATKEEYIHCIKNTVTSADEADLVLFNVEVLRKHCEENKLGKKLSKATKEELIKLIADAPDN